MKREKMHGFQPIKPQVTKLLLSGNLSLSAKPKISFMVIGLLLNINYKKLGQILFTISNIVLALNCTTGLLVLSKGYPQISHFLSHVLSKQVTHILFFKPVIKYNT